jgi:hypothetical protein
MGTCPQESENQPKSPKSSKVEQSRAFDLQTAKSLWACDGLNPLIYSSPVYGDAVLVAMRGFLGTLVAVKPGLRFAF